MVYIYIYRYIKRDECGYGLSMGEWRAIKFTFKARRMVGSSIYY